MSDAKRHAMTGLALVGAALLMGCATTHITSQANLMASEATYDTVMVFAAFEDLDLRKLAEGEMRTRLAYRGVTCIPSPEVFFPGEPYEAEAHQAKLADLHVKGILVLSAYGAGTSETYVPPTYYTQGNAWQSGSQVSGSSTTHVTGGYTYSKPWAKFRGELISVSSEHRIWVATANSTGARGATEHTLIRSFCGQVVNQLAIDGIIKPATSAGR